MATTYRIAVIGDWESVMGFRAIGLDTYPVTSAAEAKERVKELAKDGECAVIYLTEQLAREMGCRYIDVNRGLAYERGLLRAEYAVDGVHFYPDGYFHVLENLRPWLVE